jgi:hypothetical protein
MATNIIQEGPSAIPTTQSISISFRLLLGIYSIIPICLLIQFFDINYGGAYLQQALVSNPKHILLLLIIIGTPHIIASTILLSSNTDYLRFYKIKILVMTAAIIIFFGIGSLLLPYLMLYIVVAAWTIYHVLKQQHGIARGVCKLSDWQFNLQLWLSIVAGIFIYVGIFLKNSLQPMQLDIIRQIAAVLCAVLVVSTLICQRSIPTLFGKTFLWANSLLVLSSFYLYIQQYYILAILVPRLVHDTTAFIFYVAHDYNRHYGHPQNIIYRYAGKFRFSMFLILPVMSFLLAYVLQQYGDNLFKTITHYLFGMEIRKAITLGVLGYLALMHYYTESFTWKGDSPYRRFIKFSK